MPRILIVDDEAAIARLLASAFARAGYEVRTACCAADAIGICGRESFDVVISDVVMPGMNGHEFARLIAAEHPQTLTVLMSGFDLVCQACPYSPRCVLLPKPLAPARAVALVGEMLAARP